MKVFILLLICFSLQGHAYLTPTASGGSSSPGTSTVPGIVTQPSVAVLWDNEPQGNGGGVCGVGYLVPRALNAANDPFGIIQGYNGSNGTAASTFRLGPGTYRVDWQAPFFNSQRTYTDLYNITGSSTQAYGQSHYFASTNNSDISPGSDVFTITGSATYEIRYQAGNNSGSNCLGESAGIVEPFDVYTIITIEKIK